MERTGEMTWWLRALAALPGAAGSVPSTYIGQLSETVTPASRNLYLLEHMYACDILMQRHTKIKVRI